MYKSKKKKKKVGGRTGGRQESWNILRRSVNVSHQRAAAILRKRKKEKRRKVAINPSDLPTSTIGESAIKQSPPIHLWNVRVFVYYKSVIKNESSSSSNVRNQLVVDGHRRRRRIEDKNPALL
jgi:hypothetical protein